MRQYIQDFDFGRNEEHFNKILYNHKKRYQTVNFDFDTNIFPFLIKNKLDFLCVSFNDIIFLDNEHISNTELNIKIQELEERIRKLEETVACQNDRTTKLENIFYKNGISEIQLDEIIEKNENIKSNITQNGI